MFTCKLLILLLFALCNGKFGKKNLKNIYTFKEVKIKTTEDLNTLEEILVKGKKAIKNVSKKIHKFKYYNKKTKKVKELEIHNWDYFKNLYKLINLKSSQMKNIKHFYNMNLKLMNKNKHEKLLVDNFSKVGLNKRVKRQFCGGTFQVFPFFIFLIGAFQATSSAVSSLISSRRRRSPNRHDIIPLNITRYINDITFGNVEEYNEIISLNIAELYL